MGKGQLTKAIGVGMGFHHPVAALQGPVQVIGFHIG